MTNKKSRSLGVRLKRTLLYYTNSMTIIWELLYFLGKKPRLIKQAQKGGGGGAHQDLTLNFPYNLFKTVFNEFLQLRFFVY